MITLTARVSRDGSVDVSDDVDEQMENGDGNANANAGWGEQAIDGVYTLGDPVKSCR